MESSSRETGCIIVPSKRGVGSGDRRGRSLFVLLPVPRSSTIIATEINPVTCIKDTPSKRKLGVTLTHRAVDVLDVLLVISDAEKSDQYETGTNNSMSTTSSEGVCAYLSKIMGTDRLANLASFEFASSRRPWQQRFEYSQKWHLRTTLAAHLCGTITMTWDCCD